MDGGPAEEAEGSEAEGGRAAGRTGVEAGQDQLGGVGVGDGQLWRPEHLPGPNGLSEVGLSATSRTLALQAVDDRRVSAYASLASLHDRDAN